MPNERLFVVLLSRSPSTTRQQLYLTFTLIVQTMRALLLLTAMTLLVWPDLKAQSKVANYSFGKPGTNQYEHLSFWTKAGKRADVNYAYGIAQTNVPLRYLGKSQLNGKACFKVQFPNRHILFVTPQANQLNVVDATGKYSKTFVWEYEGPVNGIGTFCTVCAENEKEAMQVLQASFMK